MGASRVRIFLAMNAIPPRPEILLRSDGRRGRRAQEEIGADTPFVGLIFPEGAELKFRCPDPSHHENGDTHVSSRWNAVKRTWYCDVGGIGGGAIDLAKRLGVPLPGRVNVSSLGASPRRLSHVRNHVRTALAGSPPSR
jgi:hypothetical protein